MSQASLNPDDMGHAPHAASPPALVVADRNGLRPDLITRLAQPAQATPSLDDRFEALIQGYALEIGACALAGDTAGMEKAQRFHRQLIQMRDHWRSGNASPVRSPKKAAAQAEVA